MTAFQYCIVDKRFGMKSYSESETEMKLSRPD